MLLNIICNAIAFLWNATQMILLYSLAIILIISIIYFFCRLEEEVVKDKANNK